MAASDLSSAGASTAGSACRRSSPFRFSASTAVGKTRGSSAAGTSRAWVSSAYCWPGVITRGSRPSPWGPRVKGTATKSPSGRPRSGVSSKTTYGEIGAKLMFVSSPVRYSIFTLSPGRRPLNSGPGTSRSRSPVTRSALKPPPTLPSRGSCSALKYSAQPLAGIASLPWFVSVNATRAEPSREPVKTSSSSCQRSLRPAARLSPSFTRGGASTCAATGAASRIPSINTRMAPILTPAGRASSGVLKASSR